MESSDASSLNIIRLKLVQLLTNFDLILNQNFDAKTLMQEFQILMAKVSRILVDKKSLKAVWTSHRNHLL